MINSFPHLFDSFYKEAQAVQPKLFEIIRGYHILILYIVLYSMGMQVYFGIWTTRNLGDFLETTEIMGMTKASSFSKMSVLTKDFMIDFMVALELERSLWMRVSLLWNSKFKQLILLTFFIIFKWNKVRLEWSNLVWKKNYVQLEILKLCLFTQYVSHSTSFNLVFLSYLLVPF